MKNIIKSQSKLVVAAILLFALLSATNSCKKSSDSPGANEVYIENMAFNPSTITVAANTTITWTNKDGVPHTVTSSTDLFNSGTIANNGVYSHTFTTAGAYSYSCTIHPDMVGSVVVNATQTGGTGY
ncbi:MAG: cupredoxin family copper-binding protein [Bacteroidales bacterium]|nr:cupredoxin family copper-binding protein [Bacteroidales bacterium]